MHGQVQGVPEKSIGFRPQGCFAFMVDPLAWSDTGHGQQDDEFNPFRQFFEEGPRLQDVSQDALCTYISDPVYF
jgi:hypothetical protein